jgi:hypothetical protein
MDEMDPITVGLGETLAVFFFATNFDYSRIHYSNHLGMHAGKMFFFLSYSDQRVKPRQNMFPVRYTVFEVVVVVGVGSRGGAFDSKMIARDAGTRSLVKTTRPAQIKPRVRSTR